MDNIRFVLTTSGAFVSNGARGALTKWRSSIITNMTKLNPVHPGEILTEEFLNPLGITRHKLAIDLGIPASRIDQIAKGKRSITADTAFRLSLYFGNSAEFWMNLQSSYDLKTERERLPEIRRQVRALSH
jgi:addiction module HigA family antidote